MEGARGYELRSSVFTSCRGSSSMMPAYEWPTKVTDDRCSHVARLTMSVMWVLTVMSPDRRRECSAHPAADVKTV